MVLRAGMGSFITGSLLAGTLVFAAELININTADKETLMTLTGIGEVKAQAIIDYREMNGTFSAKEDIQNVSGIGPATYENIKDQITVSGGVSSSPPPPPSSSPSPSPGSRSSSPSPSPSPPAAPASTSGLSIDAGGDRVLIARADAEFLVRAYRDKKEMKDVNYRWNFGDGSTGRGISVSHRFEYPGRYVVVVTGSLEDDTASDRFLVTVEDADLRLAMLPDGGVEIENRAPHDADLSDWIIRSDSQRFFLPENSLILSGNTMRISPGTLRFPASASTELLYPSGALAFRAGAAEAAMSPALPAASAFPDDESSSVSTTQEKEASFTEADDERELVQAAEEERAIERATSSQVAAAGVADTGSRKWFISALGIAALGGGAMFFAKRLRRKEWDIIEE